MKKTILALALAAGLISSSAQAKIVNLDVSSYSGINGGVSAGSSTKITIAPNTSLRIYNATTFPNNNTFTGLGNEGFANTLSIALRYPGYGVQAIPFAYTSGQSIKNTTGAFILDPYSATIICSAFSETIVNNSNWYSKGTFNSPDFTSSNYLGFITSAGNYGWLNTTWTASTSQFQILGGAYQDIVGEDITAGNTGLVAAVPEPSQVAASLLLAAGIAGFVIVKRRKEASALEALAA